jgi:hypothetical protein
VRDRLGLYCGDWSGRFPSAAGKPASQSAAVRFLLQRVYQKAPMHYLHLAIAWATCLKLVMRHFAPLPTSEARRCCSAAACGLRRALRIAAIRFRASCFLTSLNEIFFTIIPYSIWCLVTKQSSGTAINRRESLLLRRLIHHHLPWVPLALSGRFWNRSGTEPVGSEVNGRWRSGAWFQKRPLSASPYRFSVAALCLAGFRVPAGKPTSQSAGRHHGVREMWQYLHGSTG